MRTHLVTPHAFAVTPARAGLGIGPEVKTTTVPMRLRPDWARNARDAGRANEALFDQFIVDECVLVVIVCMYAVDDGDAGERHHVMVTVGTSSAKRVSYASAQYACAMDGVGVSDDVDWYKAAGMTFTRDEQIEKAVRAAMFKWTRRVAVLDTLDSAARFAGQATYANDALRSVDTRVVDATDVRAALLAGACVGKFGLTARRVDDTTSSLVLFVHDEDATYERLECVAHVVYMNERASLRDVPVDVPTTLLTP